MIGTYGNNNTVDGGQGEDYLDSKSGYNNGVLNDSVEEKH